MKSLLRSFALIFLIGAICGSALAVKPPQIYTTSVPAGQNGVAYSAPVKAKFGTKPYAWSIVSGSLPTGLTIGAATGIISGTPTVNNTFAFTVRVTDSEGPAKTDDQGLFITITGAAPPPSPAVSITTGSLPSGQVSVAYNSTLQATGGTAPYAWSIPSTCVAPSCGLPAGLALSAGGTISGTPTAEGIYSLTVTVTDSSATPQTASNAYAVTIAPSTVPGAYLWSDGFESGNFSGWTGLWAGNGTYPPTVQSTIKHSGTYAYGQEYFLCGDSTNSACGAAHQDLNRWAYKYTSDFGQSAGLTHFWIRGYVYLKTPEPDATTGKITQRKLIRLADGPLGTSSATYELLLSSFSGSGGVPTNDARVVFYYYNTAGVLTVIDGSKGLNVTLNYDTWYSIEEEFQLNTPSVLDGIYRLYINGVLAYQNTAIDIRGAKSTNVKYIAFGAQVDRTTYYTVHEFRYWDDIVVSATGPIGP
jgi:hypothetical protein